MKRLRFYTSLLLIAGVVSAVLFIPFPLRVWAPFELRPHEAASVYVEVPGQLVELGVKAGETVKEGQLIAQLENSDLKLQIAHLEGERNTYQSQIESLERMRFGRTGEAAGQLDVAERLAASRRTSVRCRPTWRDCGLSLPATAW